MKNERDPLCPHQIPLFRDQAIGRAKDVVSVDGRIELFFKNGSYVCVTGCWKSRIAGPCCTAVVHYSLPHTLADFLATCSSAVLLRRWISVLDG